MSRSRRNFILLTFVQFFVMFKTHWKSDIKCIKSSSSFESLLNASDAKDSIFNSFTSSIVIVLLIFEIAVLKYIKKLWSTQKTSSDFVTSLIDFLFDAFFTIILNCLIEMTASTEYSHDRFKISDKYFLLLILIVLKISDAIKHRMFFLISVIDICSHT